MADLIIRGMEMPKDICGEPCYVDVRIFSDGSVVMAKAAPPYYGKFEAVPLPEGHGRLIDAEAYVDYMQNRYDNNEITNGDWIDFRLSLKEQPTIVPAEGRADNG